MKKKLIIAIILEFLIILGFGFVCLGIARINFNIGIIAIGVSILVITLFEIFTSNKKP